MRNAGKIATDTDINRLAFFDSGGDGPIDLFMSVFQMTNHSLKASNRLETPVLLAEIRDSDRMMEDPISSKVIRIWSTHDTDNRKILAVSTCDCVKDAQTTDGESHRTGGSTAGPGVPVCGVPCVQLIAASDVFQAGFCDEVVEEGEVEITGNCEDIGDANLHETPGKVAAQGGVLVSDEATYVFMRSLHFQVGGV